MSVFEFFRTEEWLKDLPIPQTLRISAANVGGPQCSNEIPLYSVGAFKGVEADGVVVFTRADAGSLVAQLYVAFSRARLALHAVIDKTLFARLPQLSKDSPSGEHTLFPLER